MNISFHNGVSGMMAFQEDMNRLSHNVANANTVGYKPDRSTFSDLLYTQMAVNSEKEPLTGHGSRILDSRLVYRQAPVLQTGSNLDFALLGDGFFALRRPNGDVEYTRNGSFDISIEGEVGTLVTADGSHVLDAEGEDIQLTRVSEDGLFDLDRLEDRIGIYDFPNPHGLEHSPGSCFKVSANSGEAAAVIQGEETIEGRNYQIMAGALEQSGVQLADEIVNVITTQRAFQFSAKMVQTADELEQLVNNLR